MVTPLAQRQQQLGLPKDEDGPTSPRKIVRDALTYLQNQQSRMNYGGAILSCPAAFCDCRAKPASNRTLSSGYGISRIPSSRLTDHLKPHRINQQAAQPSREGHREVLVTPRRRSDAPTESRHAQRYGPPRYVLEKPAKANDRPKGMHTFKILERQSASCTRAFLGRRSLWDACFAHLPRRWESPRSAQGPDGGHWRESSGTVGQSPTPRLQLAVPCLRETGRSPPP